MMSCAQTIKKIRRQLCMQQGEFAKKMRLSQSAIANYESGSRTPKLSTIRKLIDVAKKCGMKLTIDDFIEEDK